MTDTPLFHNPAALDSLDDLRLNHIVVRLASETIDHHESTDRTMVDIWLPGDQSDMSIPPSTSIGKEEIIVSRFAGHLPLATKGSLAVDIIGINETVRDASPYHSRSTVTPNKAHDIGASSSLEEFINDTLFYQQRADHNAERAERGLPPDETPPMDLRNRVALEADIFDEDHRNELFDVGLHAAARIEDPQFKAGAFETLHDLHTSFAADNEDTAPRMGRVLDGYARIEHLDGAERLDRAIEEGERRGLFDRDGDGPPAPGEHTSNDLPLDRAEVVDGIATLSPRDAALEIGGSTRTAVETGSFTAHQQAVMTDPRMRDAFEDTARDLSRAARPDPDTGDWREPGVEVYVGHGAHTLSAGGRAIATARGLSAAASEHGVSALDNAVVKVSSDGASSDGDSLDEAGLNEAGNADSMPAGMQHSPSMQTASQWQAADHDCVHDLF